MTHKINPTQYFSIVPQQVAAQFPLALEIFITFYVANVKSELDIKKIKPFFRSENNSLEDGVGSLIEIAGGLGGIPVNTIPNLANALRTIRNKRTPEAELGVQMAADNRVYTEIYVAAVHLAVKFCTTIMRKETNVHHLARLFAERTVRHYDFSNPVRSGELVKRACQLNFKLKRVTNFFQERQEGWDTLNGFLRKRIALTLSNKAYIRSTIGCHRQPNVTQVGKAVDRSAIEYVTQDEINERGDWGAVNTPSGIDNDGSITFVGPSEIFKYQSQNTGRKTFRQWLQIEESTEESIIVFHGTLDGIHLTDGNYDGMIVVMATIKNCTVTDRLIGLNTVFENVAFKHKSNSDEKAPDSQILPRGEKLWYFEGCEFKNGSKFEHCLLKKKEQFVNCEGDKGTVETIEQCSETTLMIHAIEKLFAAQKDVQSATKEVDKVTLPTEGPFLSQLKSRPKPEYSTDEALKLLKDWKVVDPEEQPASWVAYGEKQQTVELTHRYAAMQLEKGQCDYVIQLNTQSAAALIADIIGIARKFGMQLGASPKEEVIETFFSQLAKLEVSILFVLFNFNPSNFAEEVTSTTIFRRIHGRFPCVIGAPENAKQLLDDYCDELPRLTVQQVADVKDADEKLSTPLNDITAHCALLNCEIIPDSLKSQEQKEDDEVNIDDYAQLREDFINQGQGALLKNTMMALLDKFLEENAFATNSTAHNVMAKNAAILPTLITFLENVERFFDSENTENLLDQITGEEMLEIKQKLAILYTRASHNTMQRGWFEDAEVYIQKAASCWEGAEPTEQSSWLIQSWYVKMMRYLARLPWLAGKTDLDDAAAGMQDAIEVWKALVPSSEKEQKDHALHICIFYQDLVGILLRQATTVDNVNLQTHYLTTAERISEDEIRPRLENFNAFGVYKQYTNRARMAWLRAKNAENPEKFISQAEDDFAFAEKYKSDAEMDNEGKVKRDTAGLYRSWGQFCMEQADSKQWDPQTRQNYLIKAIELYNKAYANACAFVGGERHPIRFEVTLVLAEASFFQIEILRETGSFEENTEVVELLSVSLEQIKGLLGECNEMLESSSVFKLSDDMIQRFNDFKHKFDQCLQSIEEPLEQAMKQLNESSVAGRKSSEVDNEEQQEQRSSISLS